MFSFIATPSKSLSAAALFAAVSFTGLTAAPAFADRPSGGDMRPGAELCTPLEIYWIDSYEAQQCFLSGGELYCSGFNQWQCCDDDASCSTSGEYSSRIDRVAPGYGDRLQDSPHVNARNRAPRADNRRVRDYRGRAPERRANGRVENRRRAADRVRDNRRPSVRVRSGDDRNTRTRDNRRNDPCASDRVDCLPRSDD